MAKRDLDAAFEDFSQAIKLDPKKGDVWSVRASARFHRQQWEGAIEDFSNAVALAPEVHANWYHRGLARMELGEWDNAVEDFTKIVEGWPAQPGGWYLRGAALAQAGHPDRAMADLRRAVAAGYDDVAQWKDDSKLEPLRSRNDFIELSAQVDSQRKQTQRQPPQGAY